jgi:hypothetical protein
LIRTRKNKGRDMSVMYKKRVYKLRLFSIIKENEAKISALGKPTKVEGIINPLLLKTFILLNNHENYS